MESVAVAGTPGTMQGSIAHSSSIRFLPYIASMRRPIHPLRTLDLTFVAKRTDWNAWEAQPIEVMRQSFPVSMQSQRHSVNMKVKAL
jgi:hypothetical protein